MSVSANALLRRMQGQRVLVLGDVMLDEYVMGDTERLSPEAPVPVVTRRGHRAEVGGAGNVARNLQALGAEPMLVSVIGEDGAGRLLRAALDRQNLPHRLTVVPGRPTTHKLRVLAGHQHLVRIDEEETGPLTPDATEELLGALADVPRASVIILSDYAKGVLGPELVRAVVALAQEWDAPVLVDPKRTDFRAYRGATFLTPNALEAARASGMGTQTAEGVALACRRLLEDSAARGILLTRGALGMALVTQSHEGPPHFVEAQRRAVYDVTGAGDTVIATFGLCLAAGLDARDAMEWANRAAGVVVTKPGAAVCTPEELCATVASPTRRRKDSGPLLTWAEAQERTVEIRRRGGKVVFTNGCFDILHAGHVTLLEEARERGDALFVGVNADASVRRLKGPSRPIHSLEDRARVLCALSAVDGVVAFEEDTPLELILALRPDVLVKGGDYQLETIVGASEVQGWGGEVHIVPTVGSHSTTAILRQRPEGRGALVTQRPTREGALSA